MPSTDTPINADALNNNFKEVLNLVYPIGRGFIDFTDTDYSNYLGFTWEKTLIGLIPIGAGTHNDKNNKQMSFTLGQEYGEYEHKLNVNELASHPHNFQGGSALFTQPNQGIKGLGPGSYWVEGVGAIPNTSNAGGDQPHNNIQPSYAVNYWKRIA